MAKTDNLRSLGDLPAEELREISRRAGVASGKAKRRKKAIRENIKALLKEPAPDAVKETFARAGYEIDNNVDAVVASMIMGAIKGNPRMVDRIIKIIGEDDITNARKAEIEIAKARLDIDRQRAEMDREKRRVMIEAIKARNEVEMEDDGFLEALRNTAAEDWTGEETGE